ncbi:hypothetical protein D3C85_1434170 [compost metagenome]
MSTCRSADTLLSSASICVHRLSASNTRLAIQNARVMSAAENADSSCRRNTKVTPMRLMIWLASWLAMISRFRW